MKNGYCSLRAELSAQLHTDRDGVVEWANEQARLAKQFFFAHIYCFNYNTLTTTVSHSFYYLTLAFTYSAHGPNTFSLLSAVRFHLRRLK